MAKKKTAEPPINEFVPLMTVGDKDEADFIRSQLEANEIPVRTEKETIDPEEQPDKEPGIAVLVPEDHLDEAEAVLDQRASSNEWIVEEDDDYKGSDDSGDFEPLDDYDDDDPLADLELDESGIEEELF